MDGGKKGKPRVCFVSDDVIGKKIRGYRVNPCIFENVVRTGESVDDTPVPMKRTKDSIVLSASCGDNDGQARKEKQKETQTRRRAQKQTNDVKPQTAKRVLRERKCVVTIQRMTEVQQTQEDSESSEESATEIDASDNETSDNEIQSKLPSEENEENRLKKTSKERKKTNTETKMTKLKEMAEEYFAVHHQKKIVTSDRTLSKLQNPRMTQKDLQEHLAEATGSHKKECARLFRQFVALFPKWIFQLRHGFNILLHGLGSKRKLLDDFRKQMLPNLCHIVVNGFFPSLTIKSVLNMISEDILQYTGSFKSIIDQCNFIKSEYNTDEADELFLIIHNIDGPMLRNSKTQNAISYLATSSKIHIIASIDHINAPIIWDQNRSSRFSWLWYNTTTYERYTEETSFENSLLVQQTGSLALRSLTHVLRSLTPNARGIFKLLVQYQLDNDADTYYTGMSFGDLYQKCREKFLVNSDLTLRAQLTEFKDHKLIKFKKGTDGVETLLIPLSSSNLRQFMEESDL